MELAENAKPPVTKRRHVYLVGGFAFVPHPSARGLWLRIDKCVLLADCPHCGVKLGHLCVGKQGPHLGTHWRRRAAAKGKAKLLATSVSAANAVLHVNLGSWLECG